MTIATRLAPCLMAAALACSDTTAPSPAGAWGGPEVSLLLSDTGGTLSYLCGAGTINGGWTVSRGGEFAGVGQHFFGGGPIPPEGRPPHEALYTGRLQGDRLRLSIALPALQQTLGPYTLVRDGPAVQELCF
jgi:hypothetical protein